MNLYALYGLNFLFQVSSLKLIFEFALDFCKPIKLFFYFPKLIFLPIGNW